MMKKTINGKTVALKVVKRSGPKAMDLISAADVEWQKGQAIALIAASVRIKQMQYFTAHI